MKLKFTKGNAKLDKSIYILSLPAGFSCKGALKCLSTANRKTGKIKDGKHTEFRCYAASQEAMYPSVRESRWKNFDLLKKAKTKKDIEKLILESLPKDAKIVRLHSSGDFYSQDYFDAWLSVAKQKPDVIFYAYTKSLNYWEKMINEIPSNFKLTASEGGKNDNLITKLGFKFATVVFSEDEAKKLKLEIDHDDTHAYNGDKSFALLLHGVQKANSEASKALSLLKKNGMGGYSRKISLKTI